MPEKVNYNPDILSCLANLSSDEVFTPPEIANAMLDMLPQELFRSPDTKFLDPGCKSGVFLREIAKRLNEGLKDQIPDVEQRMDHIMKNQLFAIAITQITAMLSRRSVYCSKDASGEYSVVNFSNSDGNIRYRRIEHTWVDGRCSICGASQEIQDRGEALETHAYEFIHMDDIELKELKDMKFDVIIGNPPYQLETAGVGRQAKPIYNLFVEQAKKLKPRYCSFIIPSRWFSGGFGLDGFRTTMLNDKSIRYIVDYPNAAEVFHGVDIAGGVCYFLWDRDNTGLCDYSSIENGKQYTETRTLNEYPTFIRSNRAISIVRKVFSVENLSRTLESTVSPQRPFGLPTNYPPRDSGIPCWFIQKIGRRYADPKDIVDSNHLLEKWKLLVPKSPIAGQTDFTKPVGFYYDGNTRIAKPGECCTESFIVAGAFDSEQEVLSFKSYLFTKMARFLLLQTVVSQDVLRNKFCFVPAFERYDREYDDKYLCKKWGILQEEWDYVNSRIHNYGGADV